MEKDGSSALSFIDADDHLRGSAFGFAEVDDYLRGKTGLLKEGPRDRTVWVRFVSIFPVPRAPKGDVFVLAATTFHVATASSPHAIGNTFLAFCESQGPSAEVLKVRPAK